MTICAECIIGRGRRANERLVAAPFWNKTVHHCVYFSYERGFWARVTGKKAERNKSTQEKHYDRFDPRRH